MLELRHACPGANAARRRALRRPRHPARPEGTIAARRSEIKVLIFGIGNPGRRDDGLGPALLQEMRGTDAACEFRYQLNVEDAYTVRDFDLVIFADAVRVNENGSSSAADTEIDDEGVTLAEIKPSATIAFTTHEMSPASVLALCHELYGRAPRACTLAVRGYEWDMGEGLSERGRENLVRAADILRRFLDER